MDGAGLDEAGFRALRRQAHSGETAAVLAAVDQGQGQGAGLTTRADGDGWTLLHSACRGGHQELSEGLLARGADLLALTSTGVDACFLASCSSNVALVTMLLSRGANIHTRSTYGWTSVSIASAFDRLPVVLLLISKAADLLAPLNSGRTALELWGEHADPSLSPSVLAERRATALAAWLEGPHASQVQRRADERWARRWVFVRVAVGHGLQPLAYRRAQLAAAALPHWARIPPLPSGTRAQVLALLRDKVLTDLGLFKRIVGFL
jgi:hypothetical protein